MRSVRLAGLIIGVVSLHSTVLGAAMPVNPGWVLRSGGW